MKAMINPRTRKPFCRKQHNENSDKFCSFCERNAINAGRKVLSLPLLTKKQYEAKYPKQAPSKPVESADDLLLN